MLDRYLLVLFSPLAQRIASRLAVRGITADQVTLASFGSGMLAAALIAAGEPWAALPFLLIGRALDGLDGALARTTQATDRGAFLDISLDFIFYGAIPLAFAVADPDANALPAAALLAAFLGTGTSFLAFAIIAEKRGLKSTAYPSKSFYYLGGLTEGSETILCFVLMCLLPGHFGTIAWLYAALCILTIVSRIHYGFRAFESG
jgi:phosphatidylglycerophosphate synthase